MSHDPSRQSDRESGIPVAPSISESLRTVPAPDPGPSVNRRVVWITALALALGIAAALIAQVLMRLIWFVTGLAFHGTISLQPQSPLNHHLGLWVLLVPVVGGLIVGFMARYGSRAIRGHGIPEAMEQIILNESRIPPRMTFLKPVSAAIAIGTGGPFGAEGPIIATGGALGSLLGQLLHTTAMERKTLLAAGAAAGMAATFGAPVAAVLLSIELLLFEYRARSLIPVALASATATGVRMYFDGAAPVFPMANLQQPTGGALGLYILVGAALGLVSVLVTRAVYAVEDAFERLPIHWMWWPALGGLAVGAVGYFEPRTLGVGYSNITDILSGNLAVAAIAGLAVWKFVSWSISLGSGTSGGTLAPLFTIGGALGGLLGILMRELFPGAGVDPRIAALVGMAAIFAGASRAMLASAVFAFETTLQPLGLLPLLGGCAAAFLISSLLMRHTIMTEKIARRGIRVPADYEADFLDRQFVRDVAVRELVTLRTTQTVGEIRRWIASHAPGSTHQGFPVLAEDGLLHSVVTRRSLLDPSTAPESRLADLAKRFPVIVYDDASLRDAADHMVRHNIGRLPVIERESRRLVGIITRGDLLGAHRQRLAHNTEARRHISIRDLISPGAK
ncbi:MAG: chloride channel protein [Phycisphaerales bacterium]|nr:chloride channel protein [Phycisphaerales bacterium]